MREIPPGLKKPADAAAMRAYLVVALGAIVLAVVVYLIASAIGRHAADVASAAQAVPVLATLPRVAAA